MKNSHYFKIFVVCLSCLLINIRAKSQDSTQIVLDNIFQHVDTSQVPTHFLFEHSAQFVDLKTFNGALTDSNIVNQLYWSYIYATVFTGKVYGTNPLPHPLINDSIFSLEANANSGVNPVSMLALNYNTINPNAIADNQFTVSNDQLYDVANRTSSPYILNTAFAASPFYESDYDGSLSLIFKQDLFFNTTGKIVSGIQVDFGDGNGYVSATWNNAVTVNYSDTGRKRLTIKLNFSDYTSLACYSFVQVLKAYSSSFYQPSTSTIPFAATSTHSGGSITVQYSVNNTTSSSNKQFQKPLIVVEGFDPHHDAPFIQETGYVYEDFRRAISSISFTANNIYTTFNGHLDNTGSYDLVFVNYTDGTDDIVRNAALLEDVINWVNNHKATGAQQNVVMGLSMGGLVSRYCLAKMTKASSSPQTRLLITHESPHSGANIPLGIQNLVNDFANKRVIGFKLKDLIPQLKYAVSLELRTATKQQLIITDDPDTRSIINNSFLADNGTYRQMITYGSTGPQPAYTFIATSQGSQCGIPVMPPSAEMIHANLNLRSFALLGILGYNLFGEIKINAVPNGTASQQIVYCDLKQKIRVLFISVTSTFAHFEHNSPAGIIGYDGAPAGTVLIPIDNSYSHSPIGLSSLFYGSVSLQVTHQPQFSFVPTVSALDEPNITATSLYAAHQGYNYTSPGGRNALSKYIAQEFDPYNGSANIPHITFTARNARWIFNEMQSMTQPTNDCYNQCPPNTGYGISGPAVLCSTGTYTVTSLPSNMVVGWYVTPTGLATVSVSGNTLTLTAISNAAGFITVNAYPYIPGCNSVYPLAKQVYVGLPQPVTSVTGTQLISHCHLTGVDLLAVGGAGATSFKWYTDYPSNPGYILRRTANPVRNTFLDSPAGCQEWAC